MSDRNRRPRLHVIKGMRGPNSDPHPVTTSWNRDWTPCEHGGYAFTTETMTDRYPTAEDAYFARDEEMIRSADRVLAFWDGDSAGTAHELTYARTLSKPIDLVLVNRGPAPGRHPGGDAA